MAAMTPPLAGLTSLTPKEQEHTDRYSLECPQCPDCFAIIRRLNADLVKMTQIADDAIKDANLGHEEIARLEARVGGHNRW